MSEKEIYFLRHGESIANIKGVFAGQKENSPLSEEGRNQAKKVARDLIEKNLKPSKIYVSPLLRTQETLQIIVQEAGLIDTEIIIDERIAEYDMGSLTGTPIHKITSLELVSAQNAEDPQVFMDRVHNLLEEIYKLKEQVLIISHAGVGRIIEAKRKSVSADCFYDLEPFPNAQIIKLDE